MRDSADLAGMQQKRKQSIDTVTDRKSRGFGGALAPYLYGYQHDRER